MKKNLIYITIGVIIISLTAIDIANLPQSFLFSHSSLSRIFFFISILMVTIGLYFILKPINIKRYYKFYFLILFVLLVLFGQAYFFTYLKNKNLRQDGQITKGIVVQQWSSKGKWLYKVRYKINGKNFLTATETDEDRKVQEGDSVQIKYSKRTPEIYKIIK